MKVLEGEHCLLKYLHHRDSSDILCGFGGNAFSCPLVFLKEFHTGACHHAHQKQQTDDHRNQTSKPHAPVKDKEKPHRQHRCYDSPHRVGNGVCQQRLSHRSVIVDLLAQSPCEIGVKIPQRQLHQVGNRHFSHIRCHTESRKVRTHEPGKVASGTQDCRDQGVPAIACKPFRDTTLRSENTPGGVPDKDIREYPDRCRNAGQPTAQQGQFLISAGVFQQPAQHRRLF